MPADGASKRGPERTRIFNASANPHLGALRTQVLQSAGYEVEFLSRYPEMLQALEHDRYDLLLIGHSISAQHAKDLVEIFRRHNPAGKVLVVYQSQLVPVRADDAVRAIDGPEALISTIESLCGRERREGKSA